ncbi:MAG: choice-of-anchor J domain-containing protein, partial [Phycisphaerae bacterium]|nr:choice-of-anchor J domain-containing protein [Phycisphaerae bacterium]
DCNENGIPDVCDVPPICDPNMGPCSVDCNGNLIPDECEEDCNGNGRPDDCDIAAGTSLDCNENGIPDECDLADGTSLDCNGNLVPDECDIDSGYSLDCQPNGIPDECDIASGASEDCQGNTIPDECELYDRDIVIQEGFEEAFFPPTGWAAQIQNASYTWGQYVGAGSLDGGNSADCQYDPALSPQDEWIMTPELMMVGDVTLSGETMGSVYWGITPYDNYDVEAWAVIGPTAGDGDDILIGQIDTDNWLVSWEWVTFNYVFTAPAGPFRVGFRYVGSDGAQAQIDGIVIDGSTGAPANDCNMNGIPDECDILPEFGGFCDELVQVCDTDYNGNGVPDSCTCDFADFDGDGDIDMDDFETFRVAFGTCDGDPGYNVLADVDGSGCVGVTDYQAWIACYRAANPGLNRVPMLDAASRTEIAPVPAPQQMQGQPVQPSPGAVKPYK